MFPKICSNFFPKSIDKHLFGCYIGIAVEQMFPQPSGRPPDRGTVQEEGKMNRTSKNRMTGRQMTAMFIILAVLVVIAVILISGRRVAADTPQGAPYYRSIRVEKGDSLWSIAQTYAPAADNQSLSAYVEDLRSINSLRRDAPLQVGQSLLVVYYADVSQ